MERGEKSGGAPGRPGTDPWATLTAGYRFFVVAGSTDAREALEGRAPLGHIFRKRLDARRNTKPKKSDDQLLVCTPFNPNGFHFGKIKNDRERLLKLALEKRR